MAATEPAPGDTDRGTTTGSPRRWPVLQGIVPYAWTSLPGDLLAGVTLAALGIPEVMGYTRIAGTPVVTGLYTMLLPMVVFAVAGSSRHLVVGADSATAAILAAGLAGAATTGSPRYMALAGLSAWMSGALLLAARLVRLGFLANFLSRTVLVGFLTGVGIQVAIGQLGEMLGVATHGGTVSRLVATLRSAPHAHPGAVVVSLSVIATVFAVRKVTRRVPGALVAVVGTIVVSRVAHLASHGVAVLGPLPSGLPRITLPFVTLPAPTFADVRLLAPSVLSMFVVILAQSSATSRAYATRHDEAFNENTDLVGLSLANVSAALTGTFVVNGSPTKTEMVDGAGGRSQVAQLATCLVVLVVLLFLTGPLAYLPLAALAAVVFLIGIDLVDIRGMRQILAVRRHEFLVATITAVAVVFIGVEQGIVLAIVASVIDHLRHSYAPHNSVLLGADPEHWRFQPACPGQRTRPGLVIYRFGSSLYYANAQRLYESMVSLGRDGHALVWVCLDCAAIGDVDYTSAGTLRQVHTFFQRQGVRLVFSQVSDTTRDKLDRYGITALVGTEGLFASPGDVVRTFTRWSAGAD